MLLVTAFNLKRRDPLSEIEEACDTRWQASRPSGSITGRLTWFPSVRPRAWCGMDPADVAAHYGPERSVAINGGTPAVVATHRRRPWLERPLEEGVSRPRGTAAVRSSRSFAPPRLEPASRSGIRARNAHPLPVTRVIVERLRDTPRASDSSVARPPQFERVQEVELAR